MIGGRRGSGGDSSAEPVPGTAGEIESLEAFCDRAGVWLATHAPRRSPDGRAGAKPSATGIHACLGAALARMESRIAFEEIARRWLRYVVDEAGCRRVTEANVSGYSRVPVVIES